MTPRLTLLCLPLLAAGCEPAAEDAPDPLPAARARAALALAAAEAETPPDAAPDRPDDGGEEDRTPDPDCPRCGGTGVTRTGDGLAEVPCDCRAPRADPDPGRDPERESGAQNGSNGSNAPNGSDAGGEPDAAVRVLVFTAPWCRACGPLKAALPAAGGGFELVDADADPATAAAFGVSAVPTLIRLEAGRETARTTGPRDAAGLRRFRDGGR